MHIREDKLSSGLAITAYGNKGFRLGETRIEGSIIVSANALKSWDATSIQDANVKDLGAFLGEDTIEVLLIGMGKEIDSLPQPIKEMLDATGMQYDIMDTGAAARTYNVLQSENRRAAAALIAVN